MYMLAVYVAEFEEDFSRQDFQLLLFFGELTDFYNYLLFCLYVALSAPTAI